MWRPRSDIGKLQYRDIIFKHNDQGLPIWVTMIVRFLKEVGTKISGLSALEDLKLCPLYILCQLCKHTRHVCEGLPEGYAMFLASILQTKINTIHSASPITIENWIKWDLKQAIIDTIKFKAHYLRSASSIKAEIKGVFIQAITMRATWSLNSDTFEKYYFKPRDRFNRARDEMKTIFETNTENRTTSSVFVSPIYP